MPENVGVTVTDLSRLSRDLRKANKALAGKWRQSLKKAGQIVADRAKTNASWSDRIPGTIKVSATQRRVAVKAGGDRAPHAAPFEGADGKAKFRHPVFGHRKTWVDQEVRPFLLPALKASLDQVADAVADALGDLDL
jgi:hypothetical protein